jgi:CubicO group peptidase (beta-lactamase class C family)
MRYNLLVLIIFLGRTLALAQEIKPKEIDAIESIAKKYIREYAITALSIGIVKNSEPYTFHYGYTDVNGRVPISDSTMFHLASVTKLFTATAIMQLIESGHLGLEEKLVDILPAFKMRDKRAKKITVWHLLTHTSGLMWDNIIENSPNDTSSARLFLQKLSKRKLNFRPGEKLSYKTYSNTAYDLLGMVVEKKSGKIFSDYVTENILNPLQMKRSTYDYKDIDSTYLALPVLLSGKSKKIARLNLIGLDTNDLTLVSSNGLGLINHNVYGEDYEHNPSGNLISSALELNRWIQGMLEIYSNSKSNSVLSRNSLSQMWSIQRHINNSKTSIGLGWWVYQDDKLGTSVFHVGNNPGFCSILMIFPDQKLGISVLSNASYAQKAIWNKMTIEVAQLLIKK